MRKIYASLFLIFVYVNVYTQINQNNFDFELTPAGSYTSANAVSGWTVESAQNSTLIVAPNTTYGAACNANPVANWNPGSPEFSIVATPIAPTTNTAFSIDNVIISNSPLGGNRVARLNNSNPTGLITRISRQFQVTSLNNLICYAYAGSFNGVHDCCGQPSVRIDMYNCTGSLIPLPSISATLTPSGQQCPSGIPGYSVTNGVSWVNWQTRYIDISPYIGQCVKMVVTVSDCAYSLHHGTAYFDAWLMNQVYFASGCSPTNSPFNTVSYCSGSDTAIINAPSGNMAYQWVAPILGAIPAPIGTSPNLTISPVIAGSVYTLIVASAPGYTSALTYTILPSTVAIVGLGSSSTCAGGAVGSATIAANGSGTGYNYTWLNSNSVTISTNSVVTNLAAGVYSVFVSAIGSHNGSCGTAISTVAITNAPPNETSLLNPYCGNVGYFNTNGGTNFQWYNNFTPIVNPIGNASSYTNTAPCNGCLVRLSYINSLGCHDSIKYIQYPVIPGSVSVTHNTICPGNNSGQAIIHLNSSLSVPPGINSFSVFSVGSSPFYSASLSPTSAFTFTASNLQLGSTYSLNVFDGACRYSMPISLNLLAPAYNFSISPVSSTLCQGNSLAASIVFSSPILPGQYAYSWSPYNYVSGPNLQNALITANISQGPPVNVNFYVTVTPTIANCPLTKSISVTMLNPTPPAISPIPFLCLGSLPYSVTTNPSGGTFYGNSGVSLFGLINPSMALLGSINTFTYVSPTCSVSSSGTFMIINVGGFTITGNTNISAGQATTLSTLGGSNYNWSNGVQTFSTIVSPCTTNTFSVIATNTLYNCTSRNDIVVNVLESFTVAASPSICIGQSATLIASGANTYTWSNNATTTSISVSPATTSNYTIVGQTNHCIFQQTVAVSVYSLPQISITGNYSLCPGENGTLTANGANIYKWNNFFIGNSIIISPLFTDLFTVIGKDSVTGCENYTSVTVTVIDCTGFEEQEREMTLLTIFPNPSAGLFFIEATMPLSISIYNQVGALVLNNKLESGKTEINLRGFSAGIYFIKADNKNKSEVAKFIKVD